jgi:hypothetical protein
MTLPPRAVVVYRPTPLDEQLARHGTKGAAEFFLASRGRSLADVDSRHQAVRTALDAVGATIPPDWRRGMVARADLDRFLFEPEDIVIVVGQDGLVANVAKYLDAQPVLGVNPEPGVNPGALVPLAVNELGGLLPSVAAGRAQLERRTMVLAATDDGQELIALNEVYVGHPSHQSARYQIIAPQNQGERQSSSGVLIGTGTGSTGWCRSVWQERQSRLQLPSPTDDSLIWFVREAWPSPITGTTLTEGLLSPHESLVLVSEGDGLVVFGDGIERDHLTLVWGQQLTVRRSTTQLALVQPHGG